MQLIVGALGIQFPEVVLGVGFTFVLEHLDEAVADGEVVTNAVLPAHVGAAETLVVTGHVALNTSKCQHALG